MNLYKNIFLIYFLALFACKKEQRFDCIKSTGKIVKVERQFLEFAKLNLEDNINITFVQDSVHKVIIEAGENIIPSIKTDLIGDRLFIANKNTCNWVRSYKKEIKIYVHLKNLNHILNYGYGNINNQGIFHLSNLNFHHYGNGDVNLNINAGYVWIDSDQLGDFNLRGQTTILEVNTYNAGRFDGRNMKSKICYVNNKGQSNSYISCDSILDAKIFNVGNVYYSGNPHISLKDNGKGSLIKE